MRVRPRLRNHAPIVLSVGVALTGACPAVGTAGENALPFPVGACVRTQQPPRLDGRLDDACWSLGEPLSAFRELRSGQPAKPQTTVRLLFDAQKLYIGFHCIDPDARRVKAEVTDRDGPVWNDDCVEIFLSPPRSPLLARLPASQRYFHFGVNARGVVADQIAANAASEYSPDWEARAGVVKDGWEVEIAIPFSAMKAAAKSGQVWEANFNRATREPRQYSGWAKTEGGFHDKAHFGRIVFVHKLPPRDRLMAAASKGERERRDVAEQQGPAFFPNMTRVHVPRGSAQLLRPYLPRPKGDARDYQLVLEMPRDLEFAAFDEQMGSAPDGVSTSDAPAREGVPYARHVASYHVYPASGFELSICWQDKDNHLVAYRPALKAGGTFDWMHLKRTIAPPPGSAYARPLIIKWQRRGITGTFWVDNVVFREEGSDKNLVFAGTFDEPVWKSSCLKREGKDGSLCAKFVCPERMVDRQQALWVHPDRKAIPLKPNQRYVVELDLKAHELRRANERHIAALLFRARDDAPEGTSRIFTHWASAAGASGPVRETELVILPRLKNVRPKTARIAPCHYAATFSNPLVAKAYAENVWRSGITWTYGSVKNNVVPFLWPRGHRVWLAKPGHPFAAHGSEARAFLKQHADLRAIAFNGKPKGHLFCPTWLLSAQGAEMRRLMERELVEHVNRDGYTAVNWDIEQSVIAGADGQSADRGFCLCPRCLAAFRKERGIPGADTLDAATILEKHRQAWAMFRCKQNAELVGHMREALNACVRPIELSVYSGYQCQRTREWYGVDWALLAPHLDLAIAGYGGSRKVIRNTLDALGPVPFIGGQMYYLSPRPRPNAKGWQRPALDRTPKPELWRNRLLQQFVDAGCNGVLIWYLPTMDGGAFYYTSEAAEIIAAYEDIFRKGKRADEHVRVSGIRPAHWAAFDHGPSRLLMLLNFANKAVDVQVQQPTLQGNWAGRFHGEAQPREIDPKQFQIQIEPCGSRVIVFSRR